MKISNSIIAIAAFFTVVLIGPIVSASVFYDFKVVAITGQAGLIGLGDNPSINKWGFAAFVGQLAGGESIFVGNGVVPDDPVNITPGFVRFTRRFGRAVQINDRNHVIAQDTVAGSPPRTFVRIWDGTKFDSFVAIARGGGANDTYESVFSHPSISNNDTRLEDVAAPGGNNDGICDAGEKCTDLLVFGAMTKNSTDTTIVTPKRIPVDLTDSGHYNEAQPLNIPLRPMIADDGRVVVRAGSLSTSPIRLYNNDLSSFTVIADSTMGFTALGRSPGISDDAVAVAFYGDLTAAGADDLNKKGHIVSPGPGIFVSIDDGRLIDDKGKPVRRIVKIAGKKVEQTGDGNGICEQNEVCVPVAELGFDEAGNSLFLSSFDLNTRVAVIHIPLGEAGILDDSFVVSFVGTPNAASRPNPQTGKPFTFSEKRGIWTVRVDANRMPSGIRTGANGITDNGSAAFSDDVQLIPTGQGVRYPVCVAPGSDLLLDTSPAPGDAYDLNSGFIIGDANGICHTSASSQDVQIILPGQGTPNSIAIIPGPDLLLDSVVAGGSDDVPVKPAVKPGIFNYHMTSPKPVVQIGDVIQTSAGPRSIDNFDVFDPLANAVSDENNNPRIERRGDHRMVFWASSGADQMIVGARHLDSDQDGLLDHWEINGIDIDQDGIVDLDLKAMGADPSKRDLFLQIDWLEDKNDGINPFHRHEPFPGVTRGLVDMFANAPATPDGIPAGINLHIAAGPGLDMNYEKFSQNIPEGLQLGGNLIPHVDVVYMGLPGSVTFPGVATRDFDGIKHQFFGKANKGARELAFYYAILADFFDFRKKSGVTTPVTIAGIGTNSSTANTLVSVTDAFRDSSGQVLDLKSDAVMINGGWGLGQVRRITSNTANELTVDPPWSKSFVPDASSKFVILTGEGGVAEMGEREDLSSIPGNDHIVALGGWGPEGNTQILGTAFDQRQSLAHELGHNMGLRHGGIDDIDSRNPTYQSIMNYDYLDNDRPENTGLPVIRDYSRASDPVFADWSSLQFNFVDYAEQLGNSFRLGTNGAPVGADLERTRHDKEILTGPIDSAGPTLTITAPVSGASFVLGSNLTVMLTANDNVRVESVEVAFDLNGDGIINEPGETMAATRTGVGTFEANFFSISGPLGSRIIRAIAKDPSENPGLDTKTILIGSSASILVPNGVGQTQADATSAITAVGLVVGAVTNQSSSTVPAGSVISQSPTAGSSVAAGSAVNLVVSSGPAPVIVPNVVDQTQAAATSAITAVGLVVGTVNNQFSSTILAGNVISQSLVAGSSVAAGSAVNLIISSGGLPGDVDGDSLVTCADVTIVKLSFGKRIGQAGYDPRGDVNKDGVVDIRDLAFVTQRLPAGVKCN